MAGDHPVCGMNVKSPGELAGWGTCGGSVMWFNKEYRKGSVYSSVLLLVASGAVGGDMPYCGGANEASSRLDCD